MFGAASAGKLIQYGRRRLLLLSLIVTFISAAATAYKSIYALLIGRIILGLA
jgi:predicted MFS family arabinose efflux permease